MYLKLLDGVLVILSLAVFLVFVHISVYFINLNYVFVRDVHVIGSRDVLVVGSVEDAFHRLKRAAGNPGLYLTLDLGMDDLSVYGAARSSGSSIYLSKGLLMSTWNNYDFMVFILAHEMAHHLLGHLDKTFVVSEDSSFMLLIALERSADLVAQQLMRAAGFNICLISQGFEIWAVIFEDALVPSTTHPGNLERANYLRCL